jgi:WD40 repeat protein
LQLVRELQAPGSVSAVVWNSDGTKLAVSSLGQGATIPIIPPMYLPNSSGRLITIWDSDGHVHQQIQRDLAFFEFDDTFAFVAGDRQIATPPIHELDAFALFDVDTGQLIREIPGSYPGRPRSVNGAKILLASPDQSILAAVFGAGLDQNAALYSTHDWNKLAGLPADSNNRYLRPAMVAFSRDGTLFATGEPGRRVSVYNLASWHLILSIDAFPDRLLGTFAIAFSPDGSMIAVGSAGGSGVRRSPSGRIEFVPLTNSPVRIFKISDGAAVAEYDKPPPIQSGLVWSPDGRFIAFVTERRILHLWNPFQVDRSERTIELSRGGRAGPIALSPDGAMLAAGVGANVKIYRVAK